VTNVWTYEQITQQARINPDFRNGLLAAAAVCRAQGNSDGPPCPSSMAAIYLDRLANGERP
jgi:hypothetical protein